MVIVVKDVASVARNVHIGPAIAVVVGDRNAHAEGLGVRQAGTPGHIGKCAVVVVVVERVPQRLLRREEVGWTAIYEQDIGPAVIVVVDEGTATAHGFRQIVLGRTGVVVHPRDTAFL